MRPLCVGLIFYVAACQEETLTETVATSVCASGVRWIGGDEGSSNMHPGEACNQCHAGRGDAPSFALAGTVYDVGGQSDNCFGSLGATVEITDATGKVVSLGLVDSGSFYTRQSLTMPYTAKVIRDGKETKMVTPQTVGDCNSCHASAGKNGAPGRILAP